MHWYSGSIAEAVSLSKQKNAIFVVFVEGDCELSSEMAATIDKEEVLRRLSNQDNFLAIKLKSGTVDYSHFAQLFQLVPVPSLFFIGRNGTPLEVVCPGVQADNLVTRIDRILLEHYKDKPPSITASTSFSQSRDQSANLLQAEVNASRSNNQLTNQSPDKSRDEDKRTNQDAGLGEVLHTTEAKDSIKQSPPFDSQHDTSETPNIIFDQRTTFIEKRTSILERRVDPPDNGLDDLGSATKLQKTNTAVPIPKPSPEELQAMDVKGKLTTEGSVGAQSGNAADNAQSGNAANVAQSGNAAASGSKDEVVCDDGVCVRRVRDGAGPSQPTHEQASDSATNIEDKLQRAKQIIEAKNRERQEKEKEVERQKELERRQAGRGVAELRRWQADQDLKQIQEERKREKMENNLARQRILEQIAQDRAERRNRDVPPAPPGNVPAAHAAPTSAGRARVQLKLPDGGAHSAQFAADDALAAVYAYVDDHLHVGSQYSLWSAFPRRELTERGRTLRELNLVPSAALLLLPAGRADAGPVATQPLLAFIMQLFTTMILEPASQLYSWVRARLYGGTGDRTGTSGTSGTSGPRPGTARTTGTATTGTGTAPTGTTGTTTGESAAYRRKSNVHRLGRDARPDDDNNTWNGNSTQQM